MTSRRFDIAVIGGGIIGTATAMELVMNHRVSVVLLEAEPRLASHQSGKNSGVIHAGLYYRPGSLKARYCVEGRVALERFCEDRGVPFRRCGKLVVATVESELPALSELERRGRANGLMGMQYIEGDKIREHEPHAAGIAGLYVPETGIVDFSQVAEKFAEVVREGGGEIREGTRAAAVRSEQGGMVIDASGDEIRCRMIVNCAGLYSDRVAKMCGVAPRIQIVPFRGEYYKLIPERRNLVRNLIYPVPDPRFPFLGIHFTRMINGDVEAGPNAVLALSREGYHRFSFSPSDAVETFSYRGFWKMAGRYWKMGLREYVRSFYKGAFVRALRKLLPEISGDDIYPGGSGVRAQALEADGTLVDDFRIMREKRSVHVLNAPSPAATAAIPIGKAIAKVAANALDEGE
ncbi:MAG: L-2-hydroxyglutarate oxidase [Deltaproteobacteria bacterium]|nr:L-2-hydroxyglutarate oxidase [Deltaproteobacteria bacterium]